MLFKMMILLSHDKHSTYHSRLWLGKSEVGEEREVEVEEPMAL